jgi:hypothetical protein
MPEPVRDDLTPLRLTLQPLPHALPASVRVRQLLKLALRSLGLRCVRIEPVPPASPPESG